MSRILEIKHCYECPYYHVNDLVIRDDSWCDRGQAKHFNSVLEIYNIPEWCPLPEKKDG